MSRFFYMCYNIRMKNAVGIVAEFNPFTNGHAYFIQKIKKHLNAPIIAVMSGSFVQRGEPAFANKFLRAKTAISGGVDLVLELPTAWTLRSAEHFAKGGISILQATGVIKIIACGAEHVDFDFANCVQEIANAQDKIKEGIANGLSYAQALKAAVKNLPTDPNDILALEYTKAAQGLAMLYIQRMGGNYNDTTDHTTFPSASAVRTAWPRVSQTVPESTLEILLGNAGYDINYFWRLVQYRLRMMNPPEIAQATTANEGLENFLKRAQNSLTWEDALSACSSKRYPTSRIRRLFCQLALCQERQMWEFKEPEYLRVLAFNNQGRELLKEMKTIATLPIITKAETLYAADVAATDLLATLQNQPVGLDFTTSPVYIEE